jgi:hypothetical protein
VSAAAQHETAVGWGTSGTLKFTDRFVISPSCVDHEFACAVVACYRIVAAFVPHYNANTVIVSHP